MYNTVNTSIPDEVTTTLNLLTLSSYKVMAILLSMLPVHP